MCVRVSQYSYKIYKYIIYTYTTYTEIRIILAQGVMIHGAQAVLGGLGLASALENCGDSLGIY